MAAALTIADHTVGACLVATSVVAWTRRPHSRVGPLLGLCGATWFAGTLSAAALYLHRGPLVHLHLAYPTGRLRSRLSLITVAIAYTAAAVRPLARNDPLTIGVAALVAITASAVFVPTLGPTRRALLPALGAAFAFASILGLAAIQRLSGWAITDAIAWTYDAVVAGVAVVLTVDLLHGRWAQSVVSGLVIDLGTHTGTGGLAGALGRALGDRTLTVGYWIPAERRYVDDAGATIDIDQLPPGRSATRIEQDGDPLAVLVHDDAVLDDPGHVETVAAAARLAVSSARLHAEAQRRIDDVTASRRRIVAAADAQRDRLERQLRGGAQIQLAHVGKHLSEARAVARAPTAAVVQSLEDELARTRSELDRLAHGIHPRDLVDGSLAAALPNLADRAGIPVHMDVAVGRLPAPIEAAIYFVCSEALTNTAKYGNASTVTISVSSIEDAVIAEITDDGAGGADPRNGSGLRGLTDRVEALGGTLTIDSPPGRGTRLRAELPTREIVAEAFTGASPSSAVANSG